MPHGDDSRLLAARNTARFCVENRQVTWVILIAVLMWAVWGYRAMPQRKDPVVPVKTALAVTIWPGATAHKVEELVTRPIEKAAAQNSYVTRITSTSRNGVSLVYIYLDEYQNEDVGKEFDDIGQKLAQIATLPHGAGPVVFHKDFGDTSALMLTVASPRVASAEIDLRSSLEQEAIDRARTRSAHRLSAQRVSLVINIPFTLGTNLLTATMHNLSRRLQTAALIRNPVVISGTGFVGIDATPTAAPQTILTRTRELVHTLVRPGSISPDIWPVVLVQDPADIHAATRLAAGDEYSDGSMDDFTDTIEKALKTCPTVSRVDRTGVVPRQVNLLYSQERLAAYGLQPIQLQPILARRSITAPAGTMDVYGKSIPINASGLFQSVDDIKDVAIAATPQGTPIYLRDLVTVVKGYQDPPSVLNFYQRGNGLHPWRRERAITISVQMRPGQKIGDFNDQVNAALSSVKKLLPPDLVVERTSDQPRQVSEEVHLFMQSLMEAVVLVVIVAGLGFFEIRSAIVVAISIPLTLALTFGFMWVLGVDIQQVSIASLIIALGLLVDDPVVAIDAIKREMGNGTKAVVAAWLGPTRLANAIMYATITNIVAYLPYLMLKGDLGQFIYSLPIVMTCALAASRIVTVTFIPLFGFYLLKAHPLSGVAPAPSRFVAAYTSTVDYCIAHRRPVLLWSLLIPISGVLMLLVIPQSFFPTDEQYLSSIDINMPPDTSIDAASRTAKTAAGIVTTTSAQYARIHHVKMPLQSITTFVGTGAPRFWFCLDPKPQQQNYAQLVLQVTRKQYTSNLAPLWQHALSSQLPGAVADVRQLETGEPVGVPVSVRISGYDTSTLLDVAAKAEAIMRKSPLARRVRSNWGEMGLRMQLEINPDRANLAGVTNADVAASVQAALSGFRVGTLQHGNQRLKVVARLLPEERSSMQDLNNLYVFSSESATRVPIGQIASFRPHFSLFQIKRRNQYRTVTVECFPASGVLPSQVVAAIQPGVSALAKLLPAGYSLQWGGEREAQQKGFAQLVGVLLAAVSCIYFALAWQFRSATKPIIVFAAVPFGIAGSALGLILMNQPFGFMAFLGIISLIGVIVSHIIVLFDFIEEARERGDDLETALRNAGVQRLRPILITVGATVFALLPLAGEGGPLWQPLCYAQIGGLCAATFVTLILVPMLYTWAVTDLEIISWKSESSGEPPPPGASTV